MKRGSKKGSHVGFVVSFVMFITFLVFIFAILQPQINRDTTKSHTLDYIELKLIENSSSEVTSVTVNVEESSGNQDCINLQNVDDEAIPEEIRDKLLIKNPSGEVLNYEEQDQGIEIETGQDFMGVVTIHYSEDLSDSQTSLNGCNPKAYSIGVIKTYSEITESNLLELNSTYYSNYSILKSDLGIPENVEFSFSLLDDERLPIFESKFGEPPNNVNIYVSEVPVQYLNVDGELNFGFLRINVW